MKLESDLLTYVFYKYFFLYASVISLGVFIAIITGNGSEDEGWIENLIGLTIGLISLILFIVIRKRFVRVRLDNESFEILNSNEKNIYTWNDIKHIEFSKKYFDGIIFRFKRKTEDKYWYSITDRPKKFPYWHPYKRNIWETEIGQSA